MFAASHRRLWRYTVSSGLPSEQHRKHGSPECYHFLYNMGSALIKFCRETSIFFFHAIDKACLLITPKVMTKRTVFLLAVAPLLPSLPLTYPRNQTTSIWAAFILFSLEVNWAAFSGTVLENHAKCYLCVNFNVFSVWITLQLSVYLPSQHLFPTWMKKTLDNGIWVLVLSLCCGW